MGPIEQDSINNDFAMQRLRQTLHRHPGVAAIRDVEVNTHLIACVSIETFALGTLTIQTICVEDSFGIYEFYFNGLSRTARDFFPPYPLFSPPVASATELSERIRDWKKETDWTVFKLSAGNQILGLGVLKRFGTDRPTSGLAVREEYQRMKLGLLLQTIINEQARLLGLAKLYATASPENIASIRMHQKCGFRLTGRSIPHFIFRNGLKVMDRNDVEMVNEFGTPGGAD